MEAKARYVGKFYDKHPGYNGIKGVNLIYEYRGYEYVISDPRNGCMFSAAQEHAYEQARIDRIIADKQKQAGPRSYEGSAQQAFDEFYDWMEAEA